MTQRRIFKTKSVGSVVLKELMQNIFVAELLNPSQKLVWIVSPWVSDVPLIDNRGGNFDIVNPDWRGQIVNLQDVILHMLSLETEIRLITNQEKHNDSFLRKLKMRLSETSDKKNISISQIETLHVKKGLLNDHGCLDGSMNITYQGVEINDEQVVYNSGSSIVDEERLIFAHHYGENKIV